MDAHDGRSPFMMSADGKAWLFVPSGLKDGPLPTHYEPVESPVKNPMYAQQDNPVAKKWERPDNPYHAVGDPRYPYVITTYRLTEHHSGGIPTRMVASTAELQPEGFVELSPELANQLEVAKSGVGGGFHCPRRSGSQGTGDRAYAAARDRWATDPPGRHAIPFRLARVRHRRCREHTFGDRRRSEYYDP